MPYQREPPTATSSAHFAPTVPNSQKSQIQKATRPRFPPPSSSSSSSSSPPRSPSRVSSCSASLPVSTRRRSPRAPPAPMELPAAADEYIRESIESSLGLQISSRSLQLKLLASEDARRRLQGQVFALEDSLRDASRRLDLLREEASMNAAGVRRCVEEKEAMASGCGEMAAQCAKLERECALYERDLERAMESCDELARENDELRARLRDDRTLAVLVAELEALQKEKENLRGNLATAEEEAQLLCDANKMLEKENKRLLGLLDKERHHTSDRKHSASPSTNKGKRKSSSLKDSSPVGRAIDFSPADSSRHPLSPLHLNSPHLNSPDCRMHKK